MADHLPDPTASRALVTSKWNWKCALVVAFIALLVLLFVKPTPGNVVTSPNHSDISASPLPSVSEMQQPPVGVSEHNVVSSAPMPTTTVTPAPLSVIPSKAPPIWIDIPDARISVDVSLLPMTETQRQARYWEPPNVPNAFWVDSFDQPGMGSTDLSLIMAHACEGLAVCQTIDWQFSRLSDANLVKAGTEIIVTTQAGKVCYVADAHPITYEKDQLQKRAVDVWGKAPRPEKLVLISCYTGDIEAKNVVVIASMVTCDS